MSPPEGSDPSTEEPQEAMAENRQSAAVEEQQESEAGSREEGKGVKRKREEMQSENQMEGSSTQVADL